eukprot:c10278_g1_i1.p1 GENE.c10278_g1_i1~~c10278_g1_i1.p1  ORF type:complete len:216 (+),score=61.58 c10278_g1_i1:109-756(+)
MATPSQTVYVNNLNEKIKIADLKRALYSAFSQFGTILDIVAKKTYKMRGQAFVVFANVPEATKALQMQGFPFYDKPMQVAYASAKSDAAAKAEGALEANRAARLDSKKRKRAAAEADEEGDVGEPAAKRAKPDEDEAAPHNILFVRGLPETATEKMVSTLFAQYPGFKEASLVPGQPGIAFVEYEAVQQATTALMGLQGLALPPSSKLSIAYAKQ